MSLPYGVDVTVPTVARMYDSLLGGHDNYPADRTACAELLSRVPVMREIALNSRAFLRRVVHALVTEYGIRQFIDFGCGLPAQDNVHEIAQRAAWSSRVVYVDNDPGVRIIGGTLLESNNRTAVLQADMRDVDAVFSSESVRQLIRPGQPAAALFVSALECVPDSSRPGDLVAQVAGRLPPGSMMAICQPVSDSPEVRDFVTRFMDKQTCGHWGRVRERKDVASFCAPLKLVKPELTEVSAWRPWSSVSRSRLTRECEGYGGVGFVRP